MKGLLGEMTPEFDAAAGVIEPRYRLTVGASQVMLNDWLGQGVTLTYRNVLTCRHCARQVRKLYGGGHCYDCFATLARCDLCVVSPDRCHFHLGTCREPEWGEQFCMQPHSVYLANSSGPKVGITRAGREIRRWLDQGAAAGMAIVSAPTRRAAGVLEAHLKLRLNDRTDWRRLVTGPAAPADLLALAGQLRRDLESFAALQTDNLPVEEVREMVWLADPDITPIEFPIQQYSPARRLPLGEQTPQICDNLRGIIGQYLLFSQGVVNLGDYRGAEVEIALGPAFSEPELNDSDQLSLFD